MRLSTKRHLWYLSIVWLPLLSTCASHQGTALLPYQIVTQPVKSTLEQSNPPENDRLTDIIYHVLLAGMATQREQLPVALASLIEAAHLSRDKRILTEAIRTASKLKDYPNTIELLERLAHIEPDDHWVTLSLASVKFEAGAPQKGLETLVQLTHQPDLDESILQEIASLIARKKTPEIVESFYEQAELALTNSQLVLTAALLASKLSHSEKFEHFIEVVLMDRPTWEIAALAKLAELAGAHPDQLDTYAHQYLENSPKANRFRFEYAQILIQQQKLDHALVILNQILAQQPGSAKTLFTIGLVHLELAQTDKARTAFESLLEIDPEHDQANLYLAEIARQAKQYSKAMRYLDRVTSAQRYLEAQIRLAQVLAEKDNMETGITHLQQINTQTVEEKARIILEQYNLLREHNMLERSKHLLDEGLKQYPDQPDLLYTRGLVAAQLNLLELHEKDIRKLIRLQPDNAHAYNALGYTLADKTDRLDEALALINKANDLLPNNPFILDSLGWVHFRWGNNDLALEFLQRAIKLRPVAEIAAHLGEVLWMTGNPQEAWTIWKQGQEWESDNPVLLETIQRLSNRPQSMHHPVRPWSRQTDHAMIAFIG